MAQQQPRCTHALEIHALNGLSLPLTVDNQFLLINAVSGLIVGLAAAR
ncbi:hypothetical protein SZ54_0811 [Rhizobium sp. UR51a]|nr:hypothetical protein SZ54_0811 [Rhizobium sp. UR51a]